MHAMTYHYAITLLQPKDSTPSFRDPYIYIYKHMCKHIYSAECNVSIDQEICANWLALTIVKHQTAAVVVMMGSHHRAKTGGFFFGRSKPDAIEKEMRRLSVSDAKPLEKSRVHVLTTGQGDHTNFVPGRKSLSHMETNAAAAAADVAAVLRVKVMAADMPPFMQLHAFRCAWRAYDSLDKFSSRQMAHDIKKEFDKAYGATWHCIVGTNFGSFVTHSNGCFLYFSMDKILVMLFKTKIRQV